MLIPGGTKGNYASYRGYLSSPANCSQSGVLSVVTEGSRKPSLWGLEIRKASGGQGARGGKGLQAWSLCVKGPEWEVDRLSEDV